MNKQSKRGFAKRLRDTRISKNLTQDDVAKYVGVTRVSVSLWENGASKTARYPSTKYMARLAYILQVDELFLMYGPPTKEYNVFYGSGIVGEFRKMPLVTFDFLKKKECKMSSIKMVSDYVISSSRNGDCFCLIVDDNSMTSSNGRKSFYRGCRVSVDPQKKAEPGSYVIVEKGGVPYFRQLRETDGKLWLKAINSDYKDIKTFDNIMGVVYEHIMSV